VLTHRRRRREAARIQRPPSDLTNPRRQSCGRGYDNNFPRFLPIFRQKMAFLSKNNVIVKILKKTSSRLSKTRQYFCQKFGKNILKITTSVLAFRFCDWRELYGANRMFSVL
jgi:hypothetical protein